MAIGVVATGCYDVPKPQCGFRCGAAGCPEGYTCGPDNRCRLVDAPADLVCATPDAAMPADAYSPFAILINPQPGTMLDPADAIIVAFDVEVANVSPTTFTVTNTANDEGVVGEVFYSSGSRRATFTPAVNFPENAMLDVRLDDGITAANSGRTLLPTTFPVTTGEDAAPPQILVSTPPSDATDVSVGVTINVTFSEQVTGVSGSSFTLADAAMTAVTGTVAYDAALRTATFDPTAPLAPNTTYTFTLTSAITDTAGNALLGAPVTSSFTTAP